MTRLELGVETFLLRAWEKGMSGLVGIVSRRPDHPVSEREVRQLAREYSWLRGEKQVCVVGDDRARAVLFGRPEDEPGVETSGRSWAAWSGVVYRDGSLLGASLADLDGQFAMMSSDADRGSVVVATDPFGMHAVHVAERGSKTYVSTSSVALARFLKAGPSRFGLQTFLRLGTQVGTLTHWEGVERLEPGTFRRFVGERVEQGSYWRPERDPAVARMSLGRAVDHCIEVATDTFRARLTGRPRTWSDLTGGFDTRLLNLLLRRAGVDVVANIRDQERLDVDLGDRLAREMGWDVVHLKLPEKWPEMLPSLLWSALAWADGTLEVLELSWVLWAHQRLARTHRSLLSAGGGEHYQYAGWKSEFLNAGRSNRPNLGNFVAMRMVKPSRVDVFAVDPTDEITADVRARLSAWLAPYADELNTTQLDLAYAYKSTGHFGAYRSADQAFLSAQLPFYWKPGFVAAFSTDHRFRNNHRLMRHMIERLDRRAAAVPTTKGGTAQPWRASNIHRFVPYYGTLARKAVNKLTAKAGFPILPTVAHFEPTGLPGRRSVVESLGEGGAIPYDDLRSAALFDPDKLRDFFRRAVEQRQADTLMLGRILTVELALRAADASVED